MLASLLIFFSGATLAQELSEDYLLKWGLDYQYVYMRYKEPGVMSESGQFPGVRGQLRLRPWSYFDVSLGGSYMDGNLEYNGATFDGTPVNTNTSDYVREYRLLLHKVINGFELSMGYAVRFWHNDMIISYTRDTEYKFIPLIARYSMDPFYFSVEYRLWLEGNNVSGVSKVVAGAHDVEFTQNTGEGFALEVGVQYPFGPVQGRVYVAYDYWNVAKSDIQSDGTQLLIEPKNNTSSYVLGVGFSY